METRPPLPPFSLASAVQKVRLAEDGWNTRDAAKVAMAYTPDTQWRNRAEFANSRAEAAAIGFCDDELYYELNHHSAKRRIVMEHHPMPDELLPLRHWANNPKRTPY